MSTIKSTRRSGSSTDLVRSSIGNYLKSRHYIPYDQARRPEMRLIESVKQMAVSATVEKDVSSLNSVALNSANCDAAVVEEQFVKFKAWVGKLHNLKVQNELSQLLCPLLGHFYLESLRSGYRSASTEFLKRFATAYHNPGKSTHQLFEELATITALNDVDNKPTVRAFRSCKYEARLSGTACCMLRSYLVTCGNLVLMQVLQTWFSLDVLISSAALEETDQWNAEPSEVLLPSWFEAELGSQRVATVDDKEMKQLQDAIQTVRASTAPPPPIILYSIHNSENIDCAKVSPSSKLLATGHRNSEVRICSITESQAPIHPTACFSVPIACDNSPRSHIKLKRDRRWIALRGHTGPITGLCFVPNTDILLSVSYDAKMIAWKLHDCSAAALYRGHNYPVWCLDVDRFGVYIGTGSKDATIKLWSLDRTFPLRLMAGHTQDVTCVRFHPNGSYIASGSVDKSVRMFSVVDGRLVRVFTGHSGSIQAIAFSPNGQFIASAGQDQRVRVFDVVSGKQLCETHVHKETVISLDWSHDNSTLASCSIDSTVQLSSLRIMGERECITDVTTPYTTNCSSLLSVQYSSRNTATVVGID